MFEPLFKLDHAEMEIDCLFFPVTYIYIAEDGINYSLHYIRLLHDYVCWESCLCSIFPPFKRHLISFWGFFKYC